VKKELNRIGYWLNGETNGIIIGLKMTIGMIFKLVSLETHSYIYIYIYIDIYIL